MKTRCYNQRHVGYQWYGGRGISVCPKWRANFESFKKWALENGYNDTLSIDRIDNDGDYSPENCRWVSKSAQNSNKRNNIILEINGESLHVSAWSRKSGVKCSTIRERLKRGWPAYEAVFHNPIARGEKQVKKPLYRPANNIRKITIDGASRSMTETAAFYKISYSALAHRVSRGQNPEAAVRSLLEKKIC